MNVKSIRLRLALIAAISITVALILGGFGLTSLFERHVKRRVEFELNAHLQQLLGNLAFPADGTIELNRLLPDPRFQKPLSGLYWQIEEDGNNTTLRSRSLWDFVIKLPRNPHNKNEQHYYVLKGPGNEDILVVERLFTSVVGDKQRVVRIATATNRTDLVRARRAFAGDLIPFLTLLALIFLASAWFQIVVGLKPMEVIRKSVAVVRSGKQRRINVDEPTEIMPLVTEMNSLLESQDKAMARAKERAADLAHGLKTPLMILSLIAERLQKNNESELAAEVEDVAKVMLRHTNRELSLAGVQAVTGGRSARSSIRRVTEGVIRTLSRSPRGEEIHWHVDIPDDAQVSMPVDDLTELLGPLLENAVKWAHGNVTVTATSTRRPSIIIEDDGPGVTPAQLRRIGQRGVRLDESVEGTGLGLAIANDIADAYGMSLKFGICDPHGFRVTIEQSVSH